MRNLLGVGAVLAAVAAGGMVHAQDTVEADLQTLQQAKVGTDGPGLLSFFRSRSPDEARQRELVGLLKQLGSESFAEREQASARLTALGPPARSYLHQGLASSDLEVVRRARMCLEEIDRGPGPALSAAAVRLLAVRKPAGAVQALLTYVPFSDDESVEEEVLQALARLSRQADAVDPALVTALHDPSPVRRSAAAYALGRVGNPDHRAAVRELLTAPDLRIRLRAAQGLVAGREKTAIPVLIALLSDAPLPLSWQAEELLFRLAADRAPTASVGAGDAEARKKCRAAWTAWWRDEGPALDLSRFEDVERQLGLTVIAELDSNKVWECGLDGKPRWQITGLLGPIDAQVLPGGRVLVAENRGQRVTERDLQGNILWQKQVSSNPICCQRLPNGNTFIATYQSVMEVTRDGKEVYSHHPAAAPFLFGAQKLRNGHIVYISAQNTLVEMESGGKEVRRVPVTTNGNWCSVEALPGGLYLVALMWNGKVAEVDATGKEMRSITVPGACAATRLSNGNALVACMSGNRVAEYDWTGKKVREIVTAGRPFHAHRR